DGPVVDADRPARRLRPPRGRVPGTSGAVHALGPQLLRLDGPTGGGSPPRAARRLRALGRSGPAPPRPGRLAGAGRGDVRPVPRSERPVVRGMGRRCPQLAPAEPGALEDL